MRRVAALRTYTSAEEYNSRQIIEVIGKIVVNRYDLTNELAMTEWLGGVLLLTRSKIENTEGISSIHSFFEAAKQSQSSMRLYAYHANHIDIDTGKFKDNCRINMIEEKCEDF